MKKIIILLIVICFMAEIGVSRTTKGKEFWLGFMENISLSLNGPPVFKIHINSDVTTTCTLAIPYTGLTSTFVVNANQVYVYTLPAGNYFPQGDEAIANNGIRISANDSIEVKAFHHRFYFTESTVVLPLDEIGDEYLLMAHSDSSQTNPSELVIVATQNNTSIQIIPSVTTIGSRPAAIPFTVGLQQGQMYQLQSLGDLSGTIVKSLDSSKKIAVFGGARQALVSCGSGADDHLYDQIFPISSLGTNYHVIPFSGHLSDLIKVVASQNTTTVTVTGGGSYALNKGQVATFTVNASCIVNANNPISVAQLATSQSCNGSSMTALGDPGMINLVPSDLSLKKAVFFTPSNVKLGATPDYFPMHRLNVVIKTSAIGNLKLDNVAIPSNSFNPVAANSAYSYARLLIDTLGSLQHILACDSGFNASIYSFTFYNFYGHHLGYQQSPKKVVETTGLRMNGIDDFLKVFPIPAKNTLNIHSSKIIKSIDIADLYGTTVMSQQAHAEKEIVLNIEKLSSGIYYCVIRYDNGLTMPEVIKFIK